MTVLDGKALSALEKDRIKEEVAALDFKPGLTVILVGDDPASQIYVGSKERTAENLGFKSDVIRMDKNTSQEQLLELISTLNRDSSVHGILVQLPLPAQIDEHTVINHINPDKDVDCFHPRNFGLLFAGTPVVQPCTPQGIMRLLEHHDIELKGKDALVIGRSNIVGKPIAMMLMQQHATVTIAHSRTRDLAEKAARADIIVASVGVPHMVTKDMVKPGAVIVDVGINRIDDPSAKKGYRVVGDVDYENVKDTCSAITPVPGGVGPMTIAMLMRNTLELARLNRKS